MRECAFIIGLVLICAGCTVLEWFGGITHHRLESPELKQYVAAAQRSARAELGFTPLPEAGPVRVEIPRWKKHYDVMLHIERGNLTRTVDFLVRDGQAVWSGEQEIHYGPRQFTNVDGTHQEYFVISYSTVQGSGTPKRGYIDYRGPDVELQTRAEKRLLSAADAKRIWQSWPQ